MNQWANNDIVWFFGVSFLTYFSLALFHLKTLAKMH